MRLSLFLFLLAGWLSPRITFGEETVFVGEQPLKIPIPAGFARLDGANPAMDAAMARILPATNRLLLTAAEPGDIALFRAGNPATLNRYFGLQTNRTAENRTISLAEFQEIRGQVEGQFGDSKISAVEKEIQEQLRTSDLPVELRIGEMHMLGVFEKTERSVDFGMLAKTQVGFEEVQPVAMTASVLLVRNKVLYLYIYALYHSKTDIEWTRSAARSWRESILAANQDGPSLVSTAATGTGIAGAKGGSEVKDGEWDFKGLGKNALIGGAAGALGAMLVVAWRKKRQLPPPPPMV